MSYAPLLQKLTELREAASPRRWHHIMGVVLKETGRSGNAATTTPVFLPNEKLPGAESDANAALATPAHEYAACVEALVEIWAELHSDCLEEGCSEDCERLALPLAALAKALGVTA